jgi:hypothetical protein
MKAPGSEPVVAAPIVAVDGDSRGAWISVRRPHEGRSVPFFVDADDLALLKQCRSLVSCEEHLRRLLTARIDPRRRPHHSAERLTEAGRLLALTRRQSEESDRPRAGRHGDTLGSRIRLLVAQGLFLSRDELLGHVRNGRSPHTATPPSSAVRVAPRQVSPEMRARLIRFLSSQGVEEAVARFALEGRPQLRGAGATRNVGMLLTAGHRVVSVDEEVVPDPPVEPQPGPNGFTLYGGSDPCEYTWGVPYGNRDRPAEGGGAQLRHSVSMLLGTTVGSLAATARAVDIDPNLSSASLDAIVAYGSSLRIAAVVPGVRGCRHLPLDSHVQAVATVTGREADGRSATTQLVRRTQGTVVSLGDRFDGSWFGFDNERLGVPFSPDFDDCDDLFGVMLRLSAADACVAYIPDTVSSPASRGTPLDRFAVPGAARLGTCRLLAGIVHRLQPARATANVEDWCAYVGAALEAIASCSASNFLELVYDCAYSDWMRVHAQIGTLLDREPPLARPAAPTLVALRDRIGRLLADPAQAIPRDGPGGAAGADAIPVVQQFVAEFARLVLAWPAMWLACSVLSAEQRDMLLGGSH